MAKKTTKRSSTKKAASKKKAVKKTSSAKKKSAPKKKASGRKAVSAQQRYNMIAEAAYYMAEKEGFTGDNVRHWLRAEEQINSMLR